MYPCAPCKDGKEHWFVAHHTESLRLGGPKLLGVFRFFVAPSFAIDEPLHSFLVSQPYTPTSHLAQLLGAMAEKKYTNDLIEYYTRAIRGEARTETSGARVTVADNLQLRVTNYTVSATAAAAAPTQNPSAHAVAKRKVNNAEMALESGLKRLEREKKKADDPIDLKQYKKEKLTKKNKARKIGTFGAGKVQDLLALGFVSFREFLDEWKKHTAGGGDSPKITALLAWRRDNLRRVREDPAELPRLWAAELEKHFGGIIAQFESKRQEVQALQKEFDDAKRLLEELGEEQQRVEASSASASAGSVLNNTTNTESRPIAFSAMFDKDGYNAKLLSYGRIESIQHTYFLDRKEFMEASMLQLSGRVLSLDFFYPLASRIWVTKDDGSRQRFQPYKCIADIKNEDGQIIWFGALPHAESMSALVPHLKNLRERFIYNGTNLNVVFYVDNCCAVRNKIKEAWPEALVLLDPWHWLKRWRDIIRDPNTMDGRLFLALMSRAVLVADDKMVEEKQKELSQKYQRPATLSETLKCLPTVAPDPKTMENNVMSILDWFMHRDLVTETKLATWEEATDAPKPTLVLKDRKHRTSTIRNQLEHVRKGCLTDPNKQGDPNFSNVVLYRTVGDRQFCCRGSPLNERYHLAVERDVIGCRSTMGPATAERLHWARNSDWNKKANETRNGAKKHWSREPEHLALGNSVAEQARVETLPFPDVSMPRKDPSAPSEQLGYYLGLSLPRVAEEEGLQIVEVEAEEDGRVADGDNDVNDSATSADSADFDAGNDAADIAAATTLTNFVLSMAPILQHRRTERRESTMQAFVRQSGGDPWIPFSCNLKTNNAIEKEEHRLFDENAPHYQRGAAPSSPKGYLHFAKWWEREVADRLQKSAEDEEIVLIRPKSIAQLQAHYDLLQEVSRRAVQPTDNNDAELARRRMCRTLRNSRQAMEGQIATVPATPVIYPSVVPGTMQCVPIGAALMQPQIFAAALTMLQASMATTVAGNAAPWQMLTATQPQSNPPPPAKRQRLGGDWRTLCAACGWAKNLHNQVAGRFQFGELCVQTVCGICNQSKRQHDQLAKTKNKPTGKEYMYMGKNCIFST